MPRNNGDLSQGQDDGSEKKTRKPHPGISFPLPSTVKSKNKIPDSFSLKQENPWVEGGPLADTAEKPRSKAGDDDDMFRFGAAGRRRKL